MKTKKKFVSSEPIEDRVSVDIINLLCDVFPNAQGIYIPPNKTKAEQGAKRNPPNKISPIK